MDACMRLPEPDDVPIAQAPLTALLRMLADAMEPRTWCGLNNARDQLCQRMEWAMRYQVVDWLRELGLRHCSVDLFFSDREREQWATTSTRD